MVSLALRVGVVVLGGGCDPPEAGAAVERPLGGVAVLLGSERVDDEVLGGVAEGEASAVSLRCCPAASARAVAEGRPREVWRAALELDACVRFTFLKKGWGGARRRPAQGKYLSKPLLGA